MIDFTPHPEIAPCKSKFDPALHKTWYSFDYAAIFKDIAQGKAERIPTYRFLIKNDLFFIVCFVMGIPPANHPFVVGACHDLESDSPDGGLSRSGTLDIWAREHFKSTAGTMGMTIKRVVNNPECTTAIFSFKKPAADKFLMGIKETFEKPIMVQCFPEIFYEKPETQSTSWSIQGGIRVKRDSVSRKENTVEAFGLVEGMPTGGHYDHRIYDDVETADLCENPEQMDKCFSRFEMSDNLGTNGGTEEIYGTFYSHCGPLVRIRDKKKIDGELMYKTRLKPATDDGTVNGKPVFLSQERLDKLKVSAHFNTQQLCNPTPTDEIKLPFEFLSPIEPKFLPKGRIKFVLVDPAGDAAVQKGANTDDWAILCVSVRPVLDDMGTCEVYIEDGVADVMTLATGIDAAGQMYIRNGRIQVLGVEKTANDTTYDHIQKYLRSRGRHVKILTGKYAKMGSMVLLSPKGREKNRKIEANLAWPWHNSKIFYSTALDPDFVEKLITECNLFPYYHVNILDALAYLYDLLTGYNFPVEQFEDDEEDEYGENVIPMSGRSRVGGY